MKSDQPAARNRSDTDYAGQDPVNGFDLAGTMVEAVGGWTQEDLAEEAGLATVQVSRIERGKREVRLTTILKLVSALDIPPGKLLDGLV